MRRRGFFHSPPPKPDRISFNLRKVMKYSNVVKFEVCFGCSDDSSVGEMGFELATENGRRRIC
jgi:hypothetical protein